MIGFLTDYELGKFRKPLPLVASCGECGLHQTCKSPKMPVDGNGDKKILIVGEAPGKTEDETGIPFCGESGQLLTSTLEEFGIDARKDCWITNSVICRPPKNVLPPKAVDHCRPNLVKVVQQLKPEKILLFGASAVKSLMTWVYKKDVRGIARWLGWRIPCQKLDAWLCPFWHPSFILRTDYGTSQKQNDVRESMWKKHIELALRKRGRPWNGPPDYRSRISCIVDPVLAAKEIESFHSGGKPIAWDLECDRIKPDRKDSRIIACGLSDGRKAFAYPWTKETERATVKLLTDEKVRKIGHNMKYDARWIRARCGEHVVNWYWDTMIGAHVLDNRSEITSLKFQAFVELGAETWDDHVKPFMVSSGCNEPNRLDEIPLHDLLAYNAMDALLTWELHDVQRRRMKV